MKTFFWGIVLLCMASPVFCEEGKVFTNEDLLKYKRDRGATIYPGQSPAKSEKRGDLDAAKRGDAIRKEKDYYCRNGARHKRAMDEAEHSLKKCQDKFYEKRKAAHFLISENRGDCNQKERASRRARETYQDLADKARRDNIPDGWLRCQFE